MPEPFLALLTDKLTGHTVIMHQMVIHIKHSQPDMRQRQAGAAAAEAAAEIRGQRRRSEGGMKGAGGRGQDEGGRGQGAGDRMDAGCLPLTTPSL